MPVLDINPATVIPGTSGGYFQGIAGERIVPGQACYRSARDDRFYLATAAGSRESSNVLGLAIDQADFPGQALRLQTQAALLVSAEPNEGTLYVLGAEPGSIEPFSDLEVGSYTTLIGVGAPDGILLLGIFPSLVKWAGFGTFDYFALKDEDGVVWYIWFTSRGTYARDTDPPTYPSMTAHEIPMAEVPAAYTILDVDLGAWRLQIDTNGQLGFGGDPPDYGPVIDAFTGIPMRGQDLLMHRFLPDTGGGLLIETSG